MFLLILELNYWSTCYKLFQIVCVPILNYVPVSKTLYYFLVQVWSHIEKCTITTNSACVHSLHYTEIVLQQHFKMFLKLRRLDCPVFLRKYHQIEFDYLIKLPSYSKKTVDFIMTKSIKTASFMLNSITNG